MTFFGSPTSLNTCSHNFWATPLEEISMLMGIYHAILESQLTVTKIPLYPEDVGSGPTMSILITSHDCVGTSFGCSVLVFFCQSGLVD